MRANNTWNRFVKELRDTPPRRAELTIRDTWVSVRHHDDWEVTFNRVGRMVMTADNLCDIYLASEIDYFVWDAWEEHLDVLKKEMKYGNDSK
jgi:hypothetical protein